MAHQIALARQLGFRITAAQAHAWLAPEDLASHNIATDAFVDKTGNAVHVDHAWVKVDDDPNALFPPTFARLKALQALDDREVPGSARELGTPPPVPASSAAAYIESQREAMSAPAPEVDVEFPIEAFSDIVIIERTVNPMSKGGIAIPKTADMFKLPGGRVLAVGPGRWYAAPMNAAQTMEAAVFVPTTVKVGDWVVFGKYSSGGEPLKWGDKYLVFAREGDLAGRSKSGGPIDVHLDLEQG